MANRRNIRRRFWWLWLQERRRNRRAGSVIVDSRVTEGDEDRVTEDGQMRETEA
jgi:hypothetical protein